MDKEKLRKLPNIIEDLEAVICNPDGNVSISGSKEDLAIIQQALTDLKAISAILELEGKLTPEQIQKHYDQFLGYYFNAPCSGCPEGHASFWKTITESEEWKMWKEKNSMVYDFAECEELGIMGKEHFKAFITFIKKSSLEQTREDVCKCKRKIGEWIPVEDPTNPICPTCGLKILSKFNVCGNKEQTGECYAGYMGFNEKSADECQHISGGLGACPKCGKTYKDINNGTGKS